VYVFNFSSDFVRGNPVASVIPLLFLCGCVSSYVAPTTGSIAELSIKLADSGHQAAALYEDPVECRGLRAIRKADDGVYRVKVRAGRPVSFLMGSDVFVKLTAEGFQTQHCRMVVTFVPEAGRRYKAEFAPDTTRAMCFAQLSLADLASDARDAKNEIKAVNRSHKAPLVASSPSCDRTSYPAGWPLLND